MLARQLEAKSAELLEKYPLLAITGPRQSGKTTLAQRLRPNFEYVNLELAENSDFAHNDPHGFLTAHQDGVIQKFSTRPAHPVSIRAAALVFRSRPWPEPAS